MVLIGYIVFALILFLIVGVVIDTDHIKRKMAEIIDHNQRLMSVQPDEPINPLAFLPIEEIKENVKPDISPEIERLEKLQKVYDHLRFSDDGVTFNDYVRKVECGTWHELARA